MNYVRCLKTAFVLVVFVSFIGCKSKQDKPGAAAPQEKAAGTAETAPAKPGAPVATDKDKADARTAAEHVLAQLTAGDFASVYKESAPGFKKIGSEKDFVAKFLTTRSRVGILKNPKEKAFATRPDNIHVLIYNVSNDNFTTEMRMSFERGQNGKMELVGLNQHDEPKK